jgi:hypothetical protein
VDQPKVDPKGETERERASQIFTKLQEWGSACALRGYGVMKWRQTVRSGKE